ncbi:thioesterase family protein [Saxibacter everestensis]|uniref:Thioesterase family protein n=1 Tax=Saxibacter everestensis TaxID=2909229 RepID=A0ABY8QNB1_9MICO|nr:thioesterase family protein [Brevibacteriaceae bacterium ZFBP1038]
MSVNEVQGTAGASAQREDTPGPEPLHQAADKLSLLLELRWGDMDAYNHVNNVQYLRLLEEARVRLLGSPTATSDGSSVVDGTAIQLFSRMGFDTSSLVARHVIEYRAPLEYRVAPVAIDMWVSRLGGASFDLGYEVREPDGSVSYALAETSVVFVDRSSGKPRRMTNEEREILHSLDAGPVPFRRQS